MVMVTAALADKFPDDPRNVKLFCALDALADADSWKLCGEPAVTIRELGVTLIPAGSVPGVTVTDPENPLTGVTLTCTCVLGPAGITVIDDGDIARVKLGDGGGFVPPPPPEPELAPPPPQPVTITRKQTTNRGIGLFMILDRDIELIIGAHLMHWQ